VAQHAVLWISFFKKLFEAFLFDWQARTTPFNTHVFKNVSMLYTSIETKGK